MSLETYIVSDQPETCRKCGTRTEIERCFERENREIHVCPNCKYRYELVWGDEDFNYEDTEEEYEENNHKIRNRDE
jgi:NAD-dependent SIR2 family protein deacetylase